MKLPRDVSAKELIKALRTFGYVTVKQKGSHIKVTTTLQGEHHLAIPNHNPIKAGTLNGIILLVAEHFHTTKEEVLNTLFG